MAVNPRRRTDINPAEVYETLGPITAREARWLATRTHDERDRWFGNIYGYTTSPYARHQYQQIIRKGTRR